MSEIVKEVRAVATSRGGAPDRILTRYDHERGGRVLEATLFFPDKSGYDGQPIKVSGSSPEPAPEIVMDARGIYWRRFPPDPNMDGPLGDGYWSMVPVSSDNLPVPGPYVVYRPAAVEPGDVASPPCGRCGGTRQEPGYLAPLGHPDSKRCTACAS